MNSLDHQLKALAKGLEQFKQSTRNRVVRGGVSKALRVMAKGIKGKVPPNFKDIKRAIGSRLIKGISKDRIDGKVGAGVGIKAKQKAAQGAKRNKRRGGRAGVGIGAENVHWFILGTKQRRTGTATKGRGAKAKTVVTGGAIRRTGRMPPQVPGIVQQGIASSRGEAMTALVGHIRDGIVKEAAKLAAKVNR